MYQVKHHESKLIKLHFKEKYQIEGTSMLHNNSYNTPIISTRTHVSTSRRGLLLFLPHSSLYLNLKKYRIHIGKQLYKLTFSQILV